MSTIDAYQDGVGAMVVQDGVGAMVVQDGGGIDNASINTPIFKYS